MGSKAISIIVAGGRGAWATTEHTIHDTADDSRLDSAVQGLLVLAVHTGDSTEVADGLASPLRRPSIFSLS